MAQSFRSALQILIAQKSVPTMNLDAYGEFLLHLAAAQA